MRLLLALTIIAWPFAASADPDVKLEVKPLLCIVDERTPSCEMDFLVAWQSVSRGYYCLHNDFERSPLRCWSEQLAGQARDQRTVVEEFRFWMTNGNDDTPLAVTVVEVLRMDSSDRRRKRRSRHVWDIL